MIGNQETTTVTAKQEDNSKILGHCEFCGKAIERFGEDEQDGLWTNAVEASYVQLDNGIPKIAGGYGSCQFDYNTGFLRATGVDKKLYDRIFSKLLRHETCLVCDNCIVRHRDELVTWFEDEQVDFSLSDTRYQYLAAGKRITSQSYVQLPRIAKAFVFDEYENATKLTNELNDKLNLKENYFNGQRVTRQFVTRHNGDIEIQTKDCNGEHVTHFTSGTVLVFYSTGNEMEIIPEDAFHRRFVHIPTAS